MNLIETLKVNGKARRSDWLKGEHIYIKDKWLRILMDNGKSDAPFTFGHTDDIFADDWEPVTEQQEWEGNVRWGKDYQSGIVYPVSASSMNWNKFLNKATKVKITWEE